MRVAGLFLLLGLILPWSLSAQMLPSMQQGKVVDIRMEGIDLIEKGVLYNSITTAIGYDLSPGQVAQDIKTLFGLGYFNDVSVSTEPAGPGELVLIFKLVEKARIQKFEIKGMNLLDKKTIEEQILVHRNNMIDLVRIKRDLDMLKGEYRKKGHLRTRIGYRIETIDVKRVNLYYEIDELPQVYLTKFHIEGTQFFFPLDVERLLQSAEVDCFSWVTDSGVFQEEKINQDLALITQEYLKNGFIKVHIDKPKVIMTQKRDLAVVEVWLKITEGDQYFTGELDIKSADNNKLLRQISEETDPDTEGEQTPLTYKQTYIEGEMKLKKGEVYNPFKQNEDRFGLNDIYMEQGYAFARVMPDPVIHDDTKIVDVNYRIARGEKAYIGRLEIEGNYETQDRVVRRELRIHDNELFNGVKLRDSNKQITKLGFFEPGYGVELDQQPGKNDLEVDYNIKLSEAQTGSFNASLSYSAYNGLVLSLGISKRNLFGTGKSANFTVERRQRGESLFNVSLISPYIFDSNFTNSTSVFSEYLTDTEYNTRRTGFTTGLSYPLWENWDGSVRYAYTNESYVGASAVGTSLLGGSESQTYRSIRPGVSYSSVNNPMFPSDGFDANLSAERFGGILGGTTDYQNISFTSRFFNSLNDDETVVFMAQYRQSQLMRTDPNKEIPAAQRFLTGGVTSIRGHVWGDIQGPAGYYERASEFSIAKKYPYEGDYPDCASGGSNCPANLPENLPDERKYYNEHQRGTLLKIMNLEVLFPLTREGRNIRGLFFFDAGNVWSEDRMYEILGVKKDPFYLRKSYGTGIRMITPMGVFRFEYGIKLDKKPQEEPSRLDFTISGLF
ncbi:MAG: outer membrane protein assembly factor BamA [Candidatus Lambdaproteobacteria bacterium RIFOXYD2_FULL_50_16]|uniref:Outer membrane protein assembly factor BamA n=1 Tax=Candidatus Lambdaproteobacteria bacterium RIFOXYD2_FULL_50_16 TaxID=1817772 RepID=A0A1F6GFS4_9PROT|nr:MAG: outer membrane protein assembly factor BamA [Candidatus Lambdaproteobacteria bacterium RIFOXYD2_FULL_50_16]